MFFGIFKVYISKTWFLSKKKKKKMYAETLKVRLSRSRNFLPNENFPQFCLKKFISLVFKNENK